MKIFKLILVVVLLVSLSAYAYSSSKKKPPLVGHWSFQQLTVDNPNNNVTYGGNPSLCIGDIDVKADGTFDLWNTCKIGNNSDKYTTTTQGQWHRVSANHYKACYGDICSYDVFVDKTGKIAQYAAMYTGDAINTGHYEWGYMFKDVYFDRSAIQ
jgi:hypothetical protein